MQIRMPVTHHFILIKPAQSGSYQFLMGTWGSQSPWAETTRGLPRGAAIPGSIVDILRNIPTRRASWTGCFLNTSRNVLPPVHKMATEGIHGNTVCGNSRRQCGVYYWECGQVQISDFSHCCDRLSNKSKLMEEGFILTHASRGHSLWWQELEAAGHTAFSQEAWTMNIDTWLASPFYAVWDPSPTEWCYLHLE